MTTGNVVLDTRVAFYNPATGIGNCGSYFRRTWSGADRTSAPYTVESQEVTLLSHEPPHIEFDSKTGRYYCKSGPPVVKRVVKKHRVKNPLFKAQRNEEHIYSTYIEEFFNPEILVVQRGIPNDPVKPTGFREQWSEPTGTAWSSEDDLALLGKLQDEISGQRWNAAVSIAESQKALQMIRESATKIYTSIRFARKGNFKRAFQVIAGAVKPHNPAIKARRKHTADVVAGNWLELQYGWVPLLKDAESAGAFLGTAMNRPQVFTVTARYKRNANIGNNTTVFGETVASYGKQKCYVRGQVKARISETSWAQLAGLTDPASVVWELVPYSFVVDWFVPIGDYLAARQLSGALTGTFTKSTKSVLDVGSTTVLAQSYWIVVGGDPNAFRLKRVQFIRSPMSLDVPLPGFKPLGEVASWRHTANAVALLANIFPRKKL